MRIPSRLRQMSNLVVLFRPLFRPRYSHFSPTMPLWQRFVHLTNRYEGGSLKNVHSHANISVRAFGFSERLRYEGGSLKNEHSHANISVRAFCFSESVDLKSLVAVNRHSFILHPSGTTNDVVLIYGGRNPEPKGLGAYISGSDCTCMVVFNYGSIVLFNVRDHEVDGYLEIVERHATGLLPNQMKKDGKIEYELRVMPTLNTWVLGGLDHMMPQDLNFDGIRFISRVLGRIIALHYCIHQVDELVEEFKDPELEINQLVAKANSNHVNTCRKMSLSQSSDETLKGARNTQIENYLLQEFSFAERSAASLHQKLFFLKENVHGLGDRVKSNSGVQKEIMKWTYRIAAVVYLIGIIREIMQ